jgi:hypothetical protein
VPADEPAVNTRFERDNNLLTADWFANTHPVYWKCNSSAVLHDSAEHGHPQGTVHLATTAALHFHCSSNKRVPGLQYVSVPPSVICLRTLLVAMVTRAVSLLPA